MIATRLPDGQRVRVTLDGDRLDLVPSDEPAERDLWVGPGWVDVQVNGFAGIDANDPATTPDAYARMTAALRARGVTRYLPTVITADLPRMAARLRAVARAIEAEPAVADAVPGVHVEGPFLSPEDGARGAHPRAFVIPADVAVFDELQAASGARLATHLGNGAPAMLPRHDNVIWSHLGEPRLTASATFDGHHLPPNVMRVFAAVRGA